MVLSIRGRTKCGCKDIVFFEKDIIEREKWWYFLLFLIKFIHYLLGNYFLSYKYAASSPCRSWCPRGVCHRCSRLSSWDNLALNLVDGSFLYYFTSVYHIVSCHSSHILAFCPSYFDICEERSTFATEFNIIMNLKLLRTWNILSLVVASTARNVRHA